MKENSIEEDITRVKQRIEDVKEYIEYGLSYSEYLDWENSFDNILSDYKRVLKENEELKNEVMEKDLELIGKEEYTKASMGEIIEHYYTANEDCIPISVIQNKIEELKHRKSKNEFEFACKLKGILYLQELLEERNK